MTIRPLPQAAVLVSHEASANERLYCTPIPHTSLVSYRTPHDNKSAADSVSGQQGPLGVGGHHRGLRRTVAVIFHREPPQIFVQPPTPEPKAPTARDHAVSRSTPQRPASAPPVLLASAMQPNDTTDKNHPLSTAKSH